MGDAIRLIRQNDPMRYMDDAFNEEEIAKKGTFTGIMKANQRQERMRKTGTATQRALKRKVAKAKG